MNPKTVLLSFALGTGHRQVAQNLSRELEILGHSCEHHPLEEWVPPEYDLLFRHGYLFLALKAPRVWDRMYHSSRFVRRDHLAPPVMRGRAIRAFDRTGFGGADLVVATQYNAMEVVADWKAATGSPTKLAAVVTDYDIYPLWARREVDLFLVPHRDQADLLRERGIAGERVAVTGIPIAPAFEVPHDRGATRAALALDEHAQTAMVFGGGGGMGPLRESVEACLTAPGWQVIMVCGLNGRLRRECIGLAQANPSRLRVLGYRTDIPALMQASDVVVTKAGALSLTEALYSGARVVVIPSLSGQEQVNISFMERKGWIATCTSPGQLPGILAGEGTQPKFEVGTLPPSPAALTAQALDRLARGGDRWTEKPEAGESIGAARATLPSAPR